MLSLRQYIFSGNTVRTVPKCHGSATTLLESLLTCRSLMSVERGWVSVYGVVISAYCYIFLFLMSCVFLLGGALLTGIAFRPQEVCVSSELFRLNMEVDLQGFFLGSMSRDVHSCIHWLRPRNSPPVPAFGLAVALRGRYWASLCNPLVKALMNICIHGPRSRKELPNYRVAAINPDRFQCFTVALKNILFY